MTREVEFADSEIAGAAMRGSTLHLRLAAAAVVDQDPGAPARRGHLDGASWVLHGAVLEAGALGELLGRVAHGRVSAHGSHHARLPLPGRLAGPVRLELDLANRTSLVATGSALESRVDADARYTDSLAC